MTFDSTVVIVSDKCCVCSDCCMNRLLPIFLPLIGSPWSLKQNNIEIIDATCPVVLRLQKRIKQEYNQKEGGEKQIVIYGKAGHAEVLGLIGQTAGKAIVIESLEAAMRLDFSKDIYGKTIIVEFYKKIRDVMKFPSVPSLCKQMMLDEKEARLYFSI